MESEDVGEVANDYFTPVFGKEKDVKDSKMSVGNINMLGSILVLICSY